MAHSYSSISKFETCPRQYEAQYVLKLPRGPDTEASLWGTRVHSVFEEALKGREGPLPEGMGQMAWALAPALAAKEAGMLVLSEHKVALTRDMKPVTFDSKQAWIRGIIDIAILGDRHCLLSDYKTGKKREGSWQLELSSLIGFYTWPKIEQIETRYLWLKEKDPKARTSKFAYLRGHTSAMAGRILPRIMRVERALESGVFEPKPSGLCRQWCNVTSCEHNGRKG